MEPLIFKIETQADDSGVRKYDKSLSGLDVSSRKASGALKSFSSELLQAKSGADVAAAGAESLSRVLEKSLAGAVVIGGIKIVSDQINKMAEILRSVGEATGAAVTQLERMGEIRGIDDAIKGVGILDQTLDGVTQKLGSIKDGNWFTKITASVTGATDELKAQQATLERIRDGMIAEGFLAEKLSTERNAGISEEQKLYDGVQTKLEQKLALANKIGNQALKQEAIQNANSIADIERTSLSIKLGEEAAKKEAEQAVTTQKNIDTQIKKEQELAEAQQKRFNDLYNAEVKAQEATQKRVDANLKAEQDLADKRQSLQQDIGTAKAQQKIQNAGAAQETAASMSGGLASRGMGQRETSYETGLRNSIARAEQQGRTAVADAQIQRTIDQIKGERAATGDTRFTGRTDAMNRMRDEAVEAAKTFGQTSSGTEQMAQAVAEATQALSDFQENSQASSTASESFSSNLSDLGTGFDSAMNNANNFADSITENAGNMVGDFLKTGGQSSDLGKEFDKTSEAAKELGEGLKKATPPPAPPSKGRGERGEGSLASIEKLLQKNFDELKAYAHAT